MHRPLLMAFTLGLALHGTAGAASPADLVLPALKRLKPEAQWDTQNAVGMDIDCDGQSDLAVLGRARDRIYVAFIHGPVTAASKPEIVYFALGRDQENVCSLDVSLKIASLDYDPVEQEAGESPGFRRSAQCMAFSLADNECDSFNFYWNHTTARLNWWRR